MLPAMIATDVDGTLLDENERVTDRTRDAVHAAVHAGRPFDAVLMDVHMPVMSGHAAVRVLRPLQIKLRPKW